MIQQPVPTHNILQRLAATEQAADAECKLRWRSKKKSKKRSKYMSRIRGGGRPAASRAS